MIDTDEQYESVSGRFSELVRKGRARTGEETQRMELLGVVIQDYDRRHALAPAGMSPQEALRFLMEHSGKTPTDLVPVFGRPSHVTEALNATGKISAEQARKLGKLFRVNPGIFI